MMNGAHRRLAACFFSAGLAAAHADVTIDPLDRGETDVLARAFGTNDPFVALTGDATPFFDANPEVELIVGQTSEGRILFEDAGDVSLFATVGVQAFDFSRIIAEGATTIHAIGNPGAEWVVGDGSGGSVFVSNGASLLVSDQIVFRAGTVGGGGVTVGTNGTARFPGGIILGSPPAGTPLAPLSSGAGVSVVGEGAHAFLSRIEGGATMDVSLVVQNGGVLDLSLPGGSNEIVLGGDATSPAPSNSLDMELDVFRGEAINIGNVTLTRHGGYLRGREGSTLAMGDIIYGSEPPANGRPYDVRFDLESSSFASVGGNRQIDPNNPQPVRLIIWLFTQSTMEIGSLDLVQIDQESFINLADGSDLTGPGGTPAAITFPDEPVKMRISLDPGSEFVTDPFHFGFDPGDQSDVRLIIRIDEQDRTGPARFVPRIGAAGRLLIQFDQFGFEPEVNATYHILRNGHEGRWDEISTPALPEGLRWDLSDLAIGGTITVICEGDDADIAAPSGVLDLADVDAFIGGYLSGDPIADIAEPFGVLDLTDIDKFIDAYLAGCS